MSQQPYREEPYRPYDHPYHYQQDPYRQGYPPFPGSYAPPKSHAAAILLSFFLGTLGIDRFYLGHVGLGIAKLLLSWATLGIWQLIDLILIIVKGTHGLRNINWQ